MSMQYVSAQQLLKYATLPYTHLFVQQYLNAKQAAVGPNATVSITSVIPGEQWCTRLAA